MLCMTLSIGFGALFMSEHLCPESNVEKYNGMVNIAEFVEQRCNIIVSENDVIFVSFSVCANPLMCD